MAELPDNIRTILGSAATPGNLARLEEFFAARVRAEAVAQLAEALGETLETPGDHPGEPPYRLTWERALDIARGRTTVWSDLLSRAAVADAEWLNEYRCHAAVLIPDPVAEAVAEQAETVSELNDLITTLTAESDEFDQRLAAVRAEAVAAERQRIEAALNDYAEYLEANTRESADLIAGHRHAALLIRGMAAGSVPVATPEPTDPQCSGCSHGRSLHHGRDGLRWNCLVNMCDCPAFTTAGPVATPEDHGWREHIAECKAQWEGWDHAADLERFQRTRCICGADKLNQWNYYHQGEPYPGVWSLHQLAASIYASGWADGERAQAERDRRQQRRDRDRSVPAGQEAGHG